MDISADCDSVFVQFDYASYYDQFSLSADVASHFCFKGRDNETYALSRPPMGFSLACAIAQSATWQILNFEKRSTPFTCIDNVAFAGSLRDVWHDVTLFLERCLKVNATLNDVTASMIREFLSANEEEQLRQVRSWHANQFTFLGVKYDWVSRQRSISDKTLDKLQAARRCLVSISGEIDRDS